MPVLHSPKNNTTVSIPGSHAEKSNRFFFFLILIYPLPCIPESHTVSRFYPKKGPSALQTIANTLWQSSTGKMRGKWKDASHWCLFLKSVSRSWSSVFCELFQKSRFLLPWPKEDPRQPVSALPEQCDRGCVSQDAGLDFCPRSLVCSYHELSEIRLLLPQTLTIFLNVEGSNLEPDGVLFRHLPYS